MTVLSHVIRRSVLPIGLSLAVIVVLLDRAVGCSGARDPGNLQPRSSSIPDVRPTHWATANSDRHCAQQDRWYMQY